MTEVPRGLAEAMAVASIAWSDGGTTAVAHPDCTCGHAFEHHDGFGCADVHEVTGRCACEHYRAPEVTGAITDGDGD